MRGGRTVFLKGPMSLLTFSLNPALGRALDVVLAFELFRRLVIRLFFLPLVMDEHRFVEGVQELGQLMARGDHDVTIP